MFGKQIVEVCAIVAYWVLFVPLLLVWFNIDVEDKPFDYFFKHSDQALYLIIGYLVLYRIIRYIFIDFQSIDMQLWHTLRTTKAEVDLQLKEGKCYKNLDTVDGPPANLTYSNTLKRSAPMPPSSNPPQASLELKIDCFDEPVVYANYSSLKTAPKHAPPLPPA